jgi:hypothetical protein
MKAKKDWLCLDEPGLLALIAVWLTKLADTGLRTAFKWPDSEHYGGVNQLAISNEQLAMEEFGR